MNNPVDQPKVSELLNRAKDASRILMEYDAWEMPSPPPTDPIDYAWTAQIINDLAAALIGIRGAEKGEAVAGWHDTAYLMSIIDAAIEDGFDPDEDGPLLDQIRADIKANHAPTSERVQALEEAALIADNAERENPDAGHAVVATAIRALKTTPLPGERASEVIDMLIEARNQIEFLHGRFQETASGNAVMARLDELRHKLQP